jgi:hypothetical protein
MFFLLLQMMLVLLVAVTPDLLTVLLGQTPDLLGHPPLSCGSKLTRPVRLWRQPACWPR